MIRPGSPVPGPPWLPETVVSSANLTDATSNRGRDGVLSDDCAATRDTVRIAPAREIAIPTAKELRHMYFTFSTMDLMAEAVKQEVGFLCEWP